MDLGEQQRLKRELAVGYREKEVKSAERREGKSMWKLQQVVKQHCQQFLLRLQIRELELN
jgi:hypothetical protein